MKLDLRDAMAGAVLMAVGAFFVLYSTQNYAAGTFQRMGPGMFPTLIGAGLILTGSVIAIPAFFKPAAPVHIDMRSVLVIIAGIAAFTLAIGRVGLIPSVFLAALISSRASDRLSLAHSLVLAVALSALAWLIFIAGLRLPVEAFRWN